MTPEELDEARAKEAVRRFGEPGDKYELANERELAAIAARLAREGWTPPVDSDVLAYREWQAGPSQNHARREEVLAGKWDRSLTAEAYLAGARMAHEQERERARWLVEYAVALETFRPSDSTSSIACEAHAALAKYRGEA